MLILLSMLCGCNQKQVTTKADFVIANGPSVVVKGDNVYVMFRNWLKGNRDLYIIQSGDGGNTFGQAQKLGNGNWKLDGCPMDGGGLAVDKNGLIQTVWRREGKIFSATPGSTESLETATFQSLSLYILSVILFWYNH